MVLATPAGMADYLGIDPKDIPPDVSRALHERGESDRMVIDYFERMQQERGDRVSKHPVWLHHLLETTGSGHVDHASPINGLLLNTSDQISAMVEADGTDAEIARQINRSFLRMRLELGMGHPANSRQRYAAHQLCIKAHDTFQPFFAENDKDRETIALLAERLQERVDNNEWALRKPLTL